MAHQSRVGETVICPRCKNVQTIPDPGTSGGAEGAAGPAAGVQPFFDSRLGEPLDHRAAKPATPGTYCAACGKKLLGEWGGTSTARFCPDCENRGSLAEGKAEGAERHLAVLPERGEKALGTEGQERGSTAEARDEIAPATHSASGVPRGEFGGEEYRLRYEEVSSTPIPSSVKQLLGRKHEKAENREEASEDEEASGSEATGPLEKARWRELELLKEVAIFLGRIYREPQFWGQALLLLLALVFLRYSILLGSVPASLGFYAAFPWIGALVFAVAGAFWGVFWLVWSGGSWLSIAERISFSPEAAVGPGDGLLSDWIRNFLFIGLPAVASLLPGVIADKFFGYPGPWGSVYAIGAFVLFPPLLLSAMEAGSPWRLIPSRLLAATCVQGGTLWLTFYGQAIVLLLVGLGIGWLSRAVLEAWSVLVFAWLLPSVAAVYFFLLGRLAAELAELPGLPEPEDLEKTPPQRPENSA